jgi:hypothetical protein
VPAGGRLRMAAEASSAWRILRTEIVVLVGGVGGPGMIVFSVASGHGAARRPHCLQDHDWCSTCGAIKSADCSPEAYRMLASAFWSFNERQPPW